MVKIAISGSVGVGKTTIAKKLSEKLNYKLVELNKEAIKYKIEDVPELQTFDFNIDKLIFDMNNILANDNSNQVIEGHFSHFLDPKIVDYLIIISRDLKDLKEVYKSRSYNEKKIQDNLEVESFNLCFYEGIEQGFTEEKQIFLIENNSNVDDIIDKIIEKICLK